MKIGLLSGDANGAVDPQIQQCIDAENDGFDSVWFSQVFSSDALTVIALAGQRASRINFGTAVVPTYTRHPHIMAQQAMTVQAAVGGRLTLGLGLSHKPVVEGIWGMSYDRPAQHMREYLSVMMPLLHEGKVSFAGEMFRVNARLSVAGTTPPRVLIAALAPMMLRIAGELTDGTVTWMTGAKTIETHVAPKINAAAKNAGRPQPSIVVGLPVAVTDDPDGARKGAAGMFEIYGQLPNYQRMLKIEGAESPGDVAIVGDEAAVERQLRTLASAGATHFNAAIFPAGADAGASMRRTRALLTSLIGKM